MMFKVGKGNSKEREGRREEKEEGGERHSTSS